MLFSFLAVISPYRNGARSFAPFIRPPVPRQPLYAYRCLFISIFPWCAGEQRKRARRCKSAGVARVKYLDLFLFFCLFPFLFLFPFFFSSFKCNTHFILFVTSCKFPGCTRGNTIFPSCRAATTPMGDTGGKISSTTRCFFIAASSTAPTPAVAISPALYT